jgi:hypothetical protein
MESIVKELTEALDEKMFLAKLLLRAQQTCEEHELRLRDYLGQETITQLVSERSPPKDATTVAGKYLHAVCEHTLKSVSVDQSRT